MEAMVQIRLDKHIRETIEHFEKRMCAISDDSERFARERLLSIGGINFDDTSFAHGFVKRTNVLSEMD